MPVMSSKLSDRVAAAFAAPRTPDEIDGYLTVMRENWRQAENDQRRATLALTVLIVVFELITLGLVDPNGIEAGGIKLINLWPIQWVLPVAIAYHYWQVVYLMISRGRYRRVHTYLLEIIWPLLTANKLDVLLQPHFLPIFRDPRYTSKQGAAARIHTGLSIAVACVAVIGPLVFLAYALVCLGTEAWTWPNRKQAIGLFITILTLTLLPVFQALLYIGLVTREEREGAIILTEWARTQSILA